MREPSPIALDLCGNFDTKMRQLISDTMGTMEIADVEQDEGLSLIVTTLLTEVAVMSLVLSVPTEKYLEMCLLARRVVAQRARDIKAKSQAG